jgi:hypothetical protein
MTTKSPILWSGRLKHRCIKLKAGNAKLEFESFTGRSEGPCVITKDKLPETASWSVKISDQNDQSVGVGICLRSHLEATNFRILQTQGDHGLYLMWATAYTYSHH